jgi:hypothetical protein
LNTSLPVKCWASSAWIASNTCADSSENCHFARKTGLNAIRTTRFYSHFRGSDDGSRILLGVIVSKKRTQLTLVLSIENKRQAHSSV